MQNSFLFRNFLIIFLFFIWFSLDTYPENLMYFNFSNDNSKEFLAFRFIAPYIFFLFFLFFLKKIKFNTNHKILNYIIIIIFLNFLIQTISLIVFNKELNNLNYIFLTIFFFLILINIFNLNFQKELFVISLFILSIIVLFYGLILLWWIFFNSSSLNLYGSWPHGFEPLKNLSNFTPRSSGIARSALILVIPITITLLTQNKTATIFFIFYYFLTLLILLTQSRIVILFLFIITPLIFFYILLKKKNLLFKKIFLILIMPILIWIGSLSLKEYLQKNIFVGSELIKHKNEQYEKVFRTIDPKTFTSNRYQDWNNIIKFNNNKIIGNGVMGDRLVINQTASNLFLYNYSSGGIISVALFFIVILRAFFICLKILLFEKYPKKTNILVISACFIQLFLMLRGLTENSFAVFGIDFLIFFASYFYLEKYYLKNNNINDADFKILIKNNLGL